MLTFARQLVFETRIDSKLPDVGVFFTKTHFAHAHTAKLLLYDAL